MFVFLLVLIVICPCIIYMISMSIICVKSQLGTGKARFTCYSDTQLYVTSSKETAFLTTHVHVQVPLPQAASLTSP